MAWVTAKVDEGLKHADLEERIEAVRLEATQIETRANASDAPLVQLRDEAYVLFVKKGLAEVVPVLFQKTGFHPWNRCNGGIIPAECTNKVRAIANAGASMHELSRACSVQRIPGSMGDAHEMHNQTVVAASGGQLAPVAQGSLEQFSLTCNHTTQGFRSVIAGVQCTDKDIAPSGCLSRTLLEEKCPPLVEPFSKGIPWLQLHHAVEFHFPRIIRLIIGADNITHQIARQDGTSTLFMKCHQTATVLLSDPHASTLDNNEFWAQVQTLVLRSEPQRTTDIPPYVEFCREWSGGVQDPFVLKGLDAYAKRLHGVREVPSSVINKLTSMDLGPAVGARWRGACLKLSMNEAEKPLTTADVNTMQTKDNKPLVLKADSFMNAASKFEKVDDVLKFELALHQMELRLIKHVLNRSKDFKTLADISMALYNEYVQMGGQTKCPTDWGTRTAVGNVQRPAKQGQTRMRELGTAGPSSSTVGDVLKAKRCEVGSHCIHAESKLAYTVLAFNASDVTLQGIGKEPLYKANYTMTVSIGKVFTDFKNIKEAVKEDTYTHCYVYLYTYTVRCR